MTRAPGGWGQENDARKLRIECIKSMHALLEPVVKCSCSVLACYHNYKLENTVHGPVQSTDFTLAHLHHGHALFGLLNF